MKSAVLIALTTLAYGMQPAGAALDDPDHGHRLVAAVLVAEAGGEQNHALALRAVWEVIHVRAHQRGITEEEVVRQPFQFSSMNGVQSFYDETKFIERYAGHPRFFSAMALVSLRDSEALSAGILEGRGATKGADHYYAPAGMPDGKPPYWADESKLTTVIGGHRFYKLRE